MNYKEIIDRFTSVAREYCEWLESAPLTPFEEHFTATRLVANLYASAIALPEVSDEYLPDSFNEPEVSIEQKRAVIERLGKFPFHLYWQIFQPNTEASEEPVYGDIRDDLVDIYGDVKEGLLALDAVSEPFAVFQWRTSFGFHWGRHATSALHALHMFDPDEHDAVL